MNLTMRCDECGWRGPSRRLPWPWRCPKCSASTMSRADWFAFLLVVAPRVAANAVVGAWERLRVAVGGRPKRVKVPHTMDSRVGAWRKKEGSPGVPHE